MYAYGSAKSDENDDFNSSPRIPMNLNLKNIHQMENDELKSRSARLEKL
jgi:hypothetical protein